MAKCDQGYLCAVCGEEVTSIVDSDLYLRFVIGQVDAERLHLEPERHLRCNRVLAQYIRDERFPPLAGDVSWAANPFAMRNLDPEFVERQVQWVTRGYCRLWEIIDSEDVRDLTRYPLPEVIEAINSRI